MATGLHRNEYTVAWICSTSIELGAALMVLDEVHVDPTGVPLFNSIECKFGSIGTHNVVVFLHSTVEHQERDTLDPTDFKLEQAFRGLEIFLMVGVGSGAPSLFNDIRLGDIIVQQPANYEWPYNYPDIGIILKTITTIRELGDRVGQEIWDIAQRIEGVDTRFRCPGRETDKLFLSEYKHVGVSGGKPSSNPCERCENYKTIPRPSRKNEHPHIHYGKIFLMDPTQPIKDGVRRDMATAHSGALGFDIARKSPWQYFQRQITIRGVCDYADSHQNKLWQPYAALVAAIYAKTFLLMTPDFLKPIDVLLPPFPGTFVSKDTLLPLQSAIRPSQRSSHQEESPKAEGSPLNVPQTSVIAEDRELGIAPPDVQARYLKRVEMRFHDNPYTHHQFLETVEDIRNGKYEVEYLLALTWLSGLVRILLDTAMDILLGLLRDDIDLIPGLAALLPPGYEINVRRNADNLENPDYIITDPKGVKETKRARPNLYNSKMEGRGQHEQPSVAILAGRRNQANASAEDQNTTQPLNVRDALKYLDKVKEYSRSQPQIYNDFVEILREFKQDQDKDTTGVYHKVLKLFNGDPDLMEGFEQFFPEESRQICNASRILYMEQDFSSRRLFQMRPSDNTDAFDKSTVSKLNIFDVINRVDHRTGELERTVYFDQEPPIENPEATDSGYASMRYRDNEMSITAGDSLDSDDTKTVYSDTSSVASTTKQNYISELADALFHEVCAGYSDIKSLERCIEALPELLKAFSLKLGYNAPSQMHRDVMFFIHRNRGEVAEYLKERYSRHDPDLLPDPQPLDASGMPLSEKMEFWHERFVSYPDHQVDEQSEYPPINHQDIAVENTEESPQDEAFESGKKYDTLDSPLLAYRDLIFKNPAFEWLVATLRRDFRLVATEPYCMDIIGKKIMESLPSSHRISKTRSAEAFSVTFRVNWAPLAFLAEQDYQFEAEPGEAIEKVITLTGSTNDAQALSYVEYLGQTWPTTGRELCQSIKIVVRGVPGTIHKSTLPDGTELEVSLHGAELLVEALGTGHSVAEVGQQLAWLNASLQSSSEKEGVVTCLPSIRDIRFGGYGPTRDLRSTESATPRVTCQLGFTIQPMEKSKALHNGQCWHNMFRNPVIVGGYPIPQRTDLESGHGLEIPLSMMASLAQTKHIQVFDEKVFIKSFSTLLVPTKKSDDALIWHLLYNQNGERISYNCGMAIAHTETVTASELETTRHIIGWCSDARYYAGAADACYESLKESGLPKPRGDDCILENTYLQGRRVIKGGAPFIIGNKDTPFHISRDNPIRRLQWIDKKFFVFWDEEDKRGWLVNGTSALLHLLRKSLDSDSSSSDKFNFEFCFRKDLMQEAPITHTPLSAIRVLRNTSNLKREIYPKETGYFCVEDRVDEFFEVLEKIIDHQIGVGGQEYWNMKDQEFLEGWDFNDLATAEDPIYPRLSRFQKHSGGWVDFIRSIHAVTLFGRGFGEIIRPESKSCSRWATLPAKKYYLAASIDDLRDIMRKYGDQYSSPMRLTGDIIWHKPRAIFGDCRCSSKRACGNGKHSDFIQVPLPAHVYQTLPSQQPFLLGNGGAVIFGRSKKFKWPDKGSGGVGELGDDGNVSSSGEPDAQSRDSGIGSSLISNDLISFPCDAYKVGVVCALPKELFAVRALFDGKHGDGFLKYLRGDSNNYALGHIYLHNVVAACLPSGEYGITAAANVYTHMKRSFPRLKICLLVGIGGGVPSKNIRLGDVVVSHPSQNYSGAIQYDLGKNLAESFEMIGCLQRPPQFIMTAISNLRSDPDAPTWPLEPYLKAIMNKSKAYKHPGSKKDPLSTTGCRHGRNDYICLRCPTLFEDEKQPNIHYGLIASGNQVMKNAEMRDELGDKHNVLCFEMEAAGLMNVGDCLVIRGICDYSDPEKNDVWQEYAAATAAAYAKLLLSKTTIPEDFKLPQVEDRQGKRKSCPPSSSSDPSKRLRRKGFFSQILN
ncbi:hypothetical protein TWF481_006101 [Arthrobotrys musiformis]|uniref:Nucleoside phosphorylase domain-containing protein n=1 Tax=Arthrobotrys musiformis TaxID=47236 RepID=A0AAV9WFR4_9PEZI